MPVIRRKDDARAIMPGMVLGNGNASESIFHVCHVRDRNYTPGWMLDNASRANDVYFSDEMSEREEISRARARSLRTGIRGLSGTFPSEIDHALY